MHLKRDHSPGAYNVRVQCLECYKLHTLADSIVDMDGPAFRAYYCSDCASIYGCFKIARCDRDGCRRGDCLGREIKS